MNYEDLIPDTFPEKDALEREEHCRKVIKTVGKAIFMRLFVSAILLWAVVRADMAPWVIGLMLLVLIINLSTMLPLITELKKRRRELKEILAEEE